MSTTLRVAVIGSAGRMGRFACDLLRASPAHDLVAQLGRGADLEGDLRRSEAEVALDLTEAGLGARHGRIALAAGVRPVLGTSGVTSDETRDLDRLARLAGLGGLVVPNFSLGMVRLQELAQRLVREFPHVEIVEGHRAGKKDAPSGTARESAERLEAAGAQPVGVHSLRLPGMTAQHEFVFGAPGEILTLRHECRSLEAYGPGILLALAHAATAVGIECGLRHVLSRL